MTITVPFTAGNFLRLTKQSDGTLLVEKTFAGRTPPPPETIGTVTEANAVQLTGFFDTNYPQ